MEYGEFKEMARQMHDFALGLLTKDGSHTPILFGFSTEWKSTLIDMRDAPRKKIPMRDAITEVCGVLEFIAFVAIGEAWMVEWHPNMPKEYGPLPMGKDLETHTLRKSCLQVCAIHPQGKVMWITPFSDEGGRIVLGKTSQMEGEGVRGGIPNALRRSFD